MGRIQKKLSYSKPSSKEFEKFDRAMDELLKVPHSEIKKKLDAEKEEKRKQKAVKKKQDGTEECQK